MKACKVSNMTSIGTHTQHTIVYPWVCWLWMCVSSLIAKTKEEQTEFIKGMMKNHYLPAMIGYPHHMHERDSDNLFKVSLVVSWFNQNRRFAGMSKQKKLQRRKRRAALWISNKSCKDYNSYYITRRRKKNEITPNCDYHSTN